MVKPFPERRWARGYTFLAAGTRALAKRLGRAFGPVGLGPRRATVGAAPRTLATGPGCPPRRAGPAARKGRGAGQGGGRPVDVARLGGRGGCIPLAMPVLWWLAGRER